MKSTLPVLAAERLEDGSVELSKDGAPVFKYDHWRTDLPTKTTQTVQINMTFYRLRWAVASKLGSAT